MFRQNYTLTNVMYRAGAIVQPPKLGQSVAS